MLVAALLIWLGFASNALSQEAGTADPSFNVASLGLNRNVQAAAVQSDGKILVGGPFAGSVARLNADGSADTTFSANVSASSIHALLVQSDGRIIIGGGLITVGGVARNQLARLNADGSLDASFDPGAGGDNSFYSATLQGDGKIIVSGLFYNFNGIARHGVVRLNTDGSVDASFDPGTAFAGNFGCYVAAVQSDGKIVAGGTIIQRLNTDGSVDSSFQRVPVSTDGFSGVNSIVLQSDGRAVIAGDLTQVNGVARSHVARLNADGSLDTSFDPGVGFNGAAYSLALQANGQIVAGGVFTQVDGAAYASIARLNTDGSLDASFNPGTGADGGAASVILQSDGRIVIVGSFSHVNGATYNGVARVNVDGSVDATLKADITFGPNGSPSNVLELGDGKFIVLGAFTQVNGVTRNGLARFNSDGSLDTSFDPGVGANSAVYSLATQPDGKLLLVGVFTAFNGVAANNVVRLNTDGSVDTGFNLGTGPTGYIGFGTSTYVNLVGVQPDAKIIVSGNFTAFNGVASNQITRLNVDGSVDGTFLAGSQVQTAFGLTALVIQSDGKIVIGAQSYSSSLYGYVQSLARLNTDGSVDASFNPTTQSSAGGSFAGEINAVSLQSDGKIIITGQFVLVDGVARFDIARLNADGTLDTSFVPFDDGTNSYYSLSATPQPDGKVLVNGSFTRFEGVARNSIARLNADGTLDASFDPGASLNATVASLALQSDGNIVIAGAFTQSGALVSNHLARLTSDGSLDPSFVSGEGTSSVQALLLQPDGKVLIGGNFSAVSGASVNALARLNADGSFDASFNAGFADGDTVQALAFQPDDGNVLVAATEPGTTAGATTGTRNVVLRCSGTDGEMDPSFSAGTDGVTLAIAGLTGNKAIIAGSFGLVDGLAHPNLARLNTDGSVDTDFVGTTDAAVRALSRQGTDGAILIAGDFANADGVPRSHVARLNADGSLDTGFDPGVGPDGPVNAVEVLTNGQVVIGGSFTSVDGIVSGGVARLNADGSLDTGFASSSVSQAQAQRSTKTLGAAASTTDSPVNIASLQVQSSDGKIVIGGLFAQVGITARHNVARLNADGSVDAAFDPGTGPNAAVHTLQIQADGRTLLGGSFTSVDGLDQRGTARLLGDQSSGSVPTVSVVVAGEGEAVEGSTVGKAFVERTGDTSTALTVLYKVVGSAKAGVEYKPVTGSVTIPAGATKAKVKIKPIDNTLVTGTLVAKIKLKASPTGSYLLGGATVAKIKVLDND